MFSKAKPLQFINIKSDGFESKLIHLRIFKADREDSPSKGRKEGRKEGREGGRKKGKISVYFRHGVSKGFSLVLKYRSHLAIL